MSALALFSSFVPRPLNRAQAEHAEKRLQQAIDTIWFVHADAMARLLLDVPGEPTAPDEEPSSARPPGSRRRRRSRPAPVRMLLARLVPTRWSGRQALQAVNMLNVAIAAVWEVYHDEEDMHQGWTDHLLAHAGGADDDDIPF